MGFIGIRIFVQALAPAKEIGDRCGSRRSSRRRRSVDGARWNIRRRLWFLMRPGPPASARPSTVTRGTPVAAVNGGRV